MNQELFHTHSACDKVLLSSASDICYPSLVLPISWSILHKFCQTCLSPHPGCARGAGRSKLFAKLLKSVGRGKSSYKEARDISEASISDGASSTDLLSAIRPSDRNVSRDVYRKFRIDHCMWLQLYEASIFVRRPGKGIVENRWGVLLPHEFFSCLACDFPDVWEELFCVPPTIGTVLPGQPTLGSMSICSRTKCSTHLTKRLRFDCSVMTPACARHAMFEFCIGSARDHPHQHGGGKFLATSFPCMC